MYVVSGFESQIYYVEEGEPIDTMFVVNLKGETNFRDLVRGTITATAGGDAGTSHIYSICFLIFFPSFTDPSDFDPLALVFSWSGLESYAYKMYAIAVYIYA